VTPQSESLIVGGRRVDANYGRSNSGIPAAVQPPESRYRSVTLESSTSDARLPVILGEGALYGPVVAGRLDDGTPVAVKTYLALRETYDRRALEAAATHEYRRGSDDLGPRFVRARALLESMDHTAAPMFLLLMDKVEGPTLESLIGTEIPAPVQRAWLTDAISALRILTQRQLIQQDIKPANIMSTANGLVFVDHGATRAMLLGTHTNDQRTMAYLAPEYWSTEEFTLEAMIFGIGLTLLDVFTEGRPYSEPEFNRATATNDRAFLRRTRDGTLNLSDETLDPEVAQTLAVMTALNPGARLDALNETRWTSTEGVTLPTTAFVSPPERPAAAPEAHGAPALDFEPVSPAKAPKSEAPAPATPEPVALDLIPLGKPSEEVAPRSWWVDQAGVDSTAVTVDQERRGYGYIGVALLVYRAYVILGVLAVGHQMTDSWKAGFIGAIVVGPLLGQALVNFDRSIVNSLRPDLADLREDAKDEKPLLYDGRYYASIVVRVAATIMVAFLIGNAVDVEIHRRDVMPVLAAEQQKMREDLEAEVQKTYGPKIEDADQTVADAISARDTARDRGSSLRKQADDERTGKVGTGRPGCGPESHCQTLLREADAAEKDYSAQRAALQKAITNATDARTKLYESIEEFKAPKLDQIERATGPIAQAKALWKLAFSDLYTLITSIALIATFMIIELFAVIMKLTMAGNNYELTQARRARLVALMGVETSRTYRARVLEVEAANRELQRNWVAVQAAEKTLRLEDRARKLYAGQPLDNPLWKPTANGHPRSQPMTNGVGVAATQEMPTPTAQR